MFPLPAPSVEREFGSSRWAQLAAVLLVSWGAVMTASALLPNSYGFGALVIPVGIGYVVTGIFVWRHHWWARLLGIVIALLGIWLGVEILPDVLNPVGEIGSTWPLLRFELAASAVPDFLIFIGLLLGGGHFESLA